MMYETYLTLYSKLNRRFRKVISSGLLLSAIGLVAMLGYTTIEFTSTITKGDAAQTTMIEAEALKYVLIDAETGQRGFIITGDERFLEPYNSAQLRFASQINTLSTAMGDKAFADTNILTLANEKMAELAKTIAVRKTEGFEPAKEYISRYLGKQIMDSIRVITQTIESRETQAVLVSSRHARQLSEAMSFEAVLILICFVALILFPWGIEPDKYPPEEN